MLGEFVVHLQRTQTWPARGQYPARTFHQCLLLDDTKPRRACLGAFVEYSLTDEEHARFGDSGLEGHKVTVAVTSLESGNGGPFFRGFICAVDGVPVKGCEDIGQVSIVPFAPPKPAKAA